MPPPPSRFAPGDRVLAPWEPMWLYPATVTDTDEYEELAAVAFDDGDAGRASFVLLRPIALAPGEFVAARRDRDKNKYDPATVVDVDGETVRVEYEDGRKDRMSVEYLRVPVAGPLAQGSRVFAPRERGWLYPATVGGIVGMVADVEYEDGTAAEVMVPDLRPLMLIPGQLVWARRERLGEKYERAAVVRAAGGKAMVEYDDGEEAELPFARVRLPVAEA
ncbi:MAG: hypothetical protein U0804_00960 [Gemmataceae bacterium]